MDIGRFKDILRERKENLESEALEASSRLNAINERQNELAALGKVKKFLAKDEIGQLKKKQSTYEGLVCYYEDQIFFIKNMIAYYDENMLHAPLDLSRVLMMLQSLIYELDKDDLVRLFGMAANAIARFSKKARYRSLCATYANICWDQYFTIDGQFIFNLEKEKLKAALSSLECVLDVRMEFPIDLKRYIYEKFEEVKEEKKEEKGSEGPIKSKTRFKELSHYYDNYVLRKVPQDKESFSVLLDECGISAAEKRYIWDLITLQENGCRQETIISVLSPDVVALYESLKKRFVTMSNTDEGYQRLKMNIEEFESTCLRLSSCSEEEKEELRMHLRQQVVALFSNNQKKIDAPVSNHLVFLRDGEVSFLFEDIEGIDNGKRRCFIPIINYRISSEKRHNFRKVLANEDFPYEMWVSYNKEVGVFFIEPVIGYFVVVGGSAWPFDYDKMKQRVLANQNAIASFVDDLKDDEKRMTLLQEHIKDIEGVHNFIERKRELRKVRAIDVN